ncbi:uncharacterized protein K02A2.6-like [Diprion similis]|uniref:uncharacterized protein K02A2.6-like n=1 Tax=Diprion similis TaxID=362088 RepID=UPI001EF866EA|nr:uncharacterized protein K02A2.6-like [Diprion similis]
MILKPTNVFKKKRGNKESSTESLNKTKKYWRCGYSNHKPDDSRFQTYTCSKRPKEGHLKKMCNQNVNQIVYEEEASDEEGFEVDLELGLHHLDGESTTSTTQANKRNHDFFEILKVEGKDICFELDSGAAVSIMPEIVFRGHFPKRKIIPILLRLDAKCKIPLVGHNWLEKIPLIQRVLYSGKLEVVNNVESSVILLYNAVPKFCKARPVPFAKREEVEEELERLVKENILVPVLHSDWATPVIVVRKAGDLFTSLPGSKFFTKLDLCNAYQQLELSEESRKFLTINTHVGLFQYTRLSFGVSSAPAIFQLVIDQMLLDFRVNSEGRHPTKEKIEVVLEAPMPQDVSQLRSFLGFIGYYSCFLPDLSTVLKPLYYLLESNRVLKWTKDCKQAFENVKVMLCNQVITHFDSTKPVVLACDASSYGVGAVILHIMQKGEERPIAFASKSLTKAEQNYAQIEREGLAIIFGLKKFHIFLAGRKFVLITDHKPLKIFGNKSGVPVMSTARLTRWAIILSSYQYDIKYKPGKDMGNADGLSRLPLQSKSNERGECYNISSIKDWPLSGKEISKFTIKDKILAKLLDFTLFGWPKSCPSDEIKPFFLRKNTLSVEQNCVIWENRVLVPDLLQKKVLDLLHEGHSGIVQTKMLARSFVWWPGIDKAIENLVKEWEFCQRMVDDVEAVTSHPWSWTINILERVHLDFGEYKGTELLILRDSFSKWVEVFVMTTTTSQSVIVELRTFFAMFGLPELVVSDNGTQLLSKEIEIFFHGNGIKHRTSPPYRSKSNGLAENSVKLVKKALAKLDLQDDRAGIKRSIQHKLDHFLFSYRNTPHVTTGKSPTELFLKRKPRTPLSMLKPSPNCDMKEKRHEAVANAVG